MCRPGQHSDDECELSGGRHWRGAEKGTGGHTCRSALATRHGAPSWLHGHASSRSYRTQPATRPTSAPLERNSDSAHKTVHPRGNPLSNSRTGFRVCDGRSGGRGVEPSHCRPWVGKAGSPQVKSRAGPARRLTMSGDAPGRSATQLPMQGARGHFGVLRY
jgi:hypothetical protein